MKSSKRGRLSTRSNTPGRPKKTLPDCLLTRRDRGGRMKRTSFSPATVAPGDGYRGTRRSNQDANQNLVIPSPEHFRGDGSRKATTGPTEKGASIGTCE